QRAPDVPRGRPRGRRPAPDLPLASSAPRVPPCQEPAETLEAMGISAAVNDMRSHKPLDEAAILESARKTGRVIVVHEASRMCGVGAEVAAIVAEQAFSSLKAPVVRITGPDAPPPSSYVLEQAFMPQAGRIVSEAEALMQAVVGA
ncbi:MAG: transketolase C-terminal domain-containing protein, partial [Vicinamibacterales bacterium]